MNLISVHSYFFFQVTFSRYQLPRQEPRQEAPWLNKYHTLPNSSAVSFCLLSRVQVLVGRLLDDTLLFCIAICYCEL